MAFAEAAFKRNLGPRTTIREPMRSTKGGDLGAKRVCPVCAGTRQDTVGPPGAGKSMPPP
jgi:hypothetical protein